MTYMFFMVWMAVAIFIPVFTPSLDVLAFGESMCGIPWGVFQVCEPQARKTYLLTLLSLISQLDTLDYLRI